MDERVGNEAAQHAVQLAHALRRERLVNGLETVLIIKNLVRRERRGAAQNHLDLGDFTGGIAALIIRKRAAGTDAPVGEIQVALTPENRGVARDDAAALVGLGDVFRRGEIRKTRVDHRPRTPAIVIEVRERLVKTRRRNPHGPRRGAQISERGDELKLARGERGGGVRVELEMKRMLARGERGNVAFHE